MFLGQSNTPEHRRKINVACGVERRTASVKQQGKNLGLATQWPNLDLGQSAAEPT